MTGQNENQQKMLARLKCNMQLRFGEKQFIYPEMVQALFKPMPKNTDRMMHAAVGLAGERRELQDSQDRANMLEEAGDLEFYLEALFQSTGGMLQEATHLLQTPSYADLLMEDLSNANAMDRLDAATIGILDIVKKAWAYEKPMTGAMVQSLAGYALEIMACLDFIYSLYGLADGFGYVQQENARKLVGPGGRFESFAYSDAQAQARADKGGAGD